MNLIRSLVAITLIASFGQLAACQELEKDLANAPDDNTVGRYGLETIKLDDEQINVLSVLKKEKGLTLTCQQHAVALHNMKRKFMMQDCQFVPLLTASSDQRHSKAQFWGESLEQMSLQFLEQKLVKIEVVLSIDEQYEKLYQQHAKRLFSLLGKPDVMNLDNVVWEANTDRAILREASRGQLHLLIQNKAINDQLIETQAILRK